MPLLFEASAVLHVLCILDIGCRKIRFKSLEYVICPEWDVSFSQATHRGPLGLAPHNSLVDMRALNRVAQGLSQRCSQQRRGIAAYVRT